MTIGSEQNTVEATERPVAWIVPGPLRQVTGGYLYDARIVDGLRARGWTIGVIDVRATSWPLDPPAGRRLLKALSHGRWAAVVVDELSHPALVAALVGGRLRCALRNAPLILLVHHLRYSEPAPWQSRAAALIVESAALRSADLVVCTSETTSRTVRPLPRKNVPIKVVRPGCDTQALCPTPSHIGTEGRLRLLIVGHWTPRKGILIALATLARLGPGVTLDLVGDQDRDPAYAARVGSALQDPALAGRVRVHGRVPDNVLANLYATADALLLPSTHEGYGMVLAEALAAGLPIVATRVGAVPEVVRHGFEAELVLPGDVEALARAIERLAADPGERKRRSRFARERAHTLPRWSDSVVAFEGHLRTLLARTLTGV
jgi:glycosyltransferase involved in cell wall biosynthesis